MSFYTKFLWILTFLLLYCEHVFFLAGYVPQNGLEHVLEACLEPSCYGGSSGLAGEYGPVLPAKEWFYMIYMFSLQPYC